MRQELVFTRTEAEQALRLAHSAFNNRTPIIHIGTGIFDTKFIYTKLKAGLKPRYGKISYSIRIP